MRFAKRVARKGPTHAHVHAHGEGCGCPAHREPGDSGGVRGWLADMLPALACALCPACLSTYAKALSVAGLAAWLSEREHLAFLGLAVLLSVVFGLRRARALGDYRPFAFTLAGCLALVVGHFAGDVAALTWVGLALLFVGGFFGQHLTVRAKRGKGAPRSTVARKRPAPGLTIVTVRRANPSARAEDLDTVH